MNKHHVSFAKKEEAMTVKNIQTHLRIYNRLVKSPGCDTRTGLQFVENLEEVFGRRSKEYQVAECARVLSTICSALPTNDTHLWEAPHP